MGVLEHETPTFGGSRRSRVSYGARKSWLCLGFVGGRIPLSHDPPPHPTRTERQDAAGEECEKNAHCGTDTDAEERSRSEGGRPLVNRTGTTNNKEQPLLAKVGRRTSKAPKTLVTSTSLLPEKRIQIRNQVNPLPDSAPLSVRNRRAQ